MKLTLSPGASEIIPLLEAADLPTSDITQKLLTRFIGAHKNESLLGAIGFESYAPSGLLRSLVVAPEARGLGLGKTLVNAIEELAASDGIETLYLLTTDAENYFSRNGYIIVERDEVPAAIRETTQFSSLCPGTATVMVKALA